MQNKTWKIAKCNKVQVNETAFAELTQAQPTMFQKRSEVKLYIEA